MSKQHSKLKLSLFFIALTMTLANTAQAGDLAQAAINMSNTLGFVANIATYVAYIVGGCYLVSALLKFKKHNDSHSQMPLSQPITECFMAATLILLPYFASLSGFNANTEKSTGKPQQVAQNNQAQSGLIQLPAPNPDFRNSDQQHLNQALGLKPVEKAVPSTSPPQEALVDIRDRYKFD